MRIIGVHGIRVTDGGAGTLRPVLDELERQGHEVDLLDYGRVRAVTARYRTEAAAADLERMRPEVTIAHSHGNNVVHRALRDGMRLKAHVAYAPAMRREAIWPVTVRRILVIRNRKDWALMLGRGFTMINPVSWFRPHPFGSAGRSGYRGKDPRMTDIDAGSLGAGWAHNYLADDPQMWANLIGPWIRAGD